MIRLNKTKAFLIFPYRQLTTQYFRHLKKLFPLRLNRPELMTIFYAKYVF
jgi:hypothetical protein